MRFFRRGKQPLRVVFDLAGDFHEDIRGSDIWLMNGKPTDRNASLERDGTYMDGFDPMQRGTVGDMTAGFPLGPWTEELAQRSKTESAAERTGTDCVGARARRQASAHSVTRESQISCTKLP